MTLTKNSTNGGSRLVRALCISLALVTTACGGDDDGPSADPMVRRCGDFLTLREAESIGMTESNIFIYDEDQMEDSPGRGLVCTGLDGGLFTVFTGDHYDTIRGGAGDPPEDNTHGQRSFNYELGGQLGTGVLTSNGQYAILVVAKNLFRDQMLGIILAHAEAR